MRRSLQTASALLILALTALLSAETIRPGTFYGTLLKDRWGRRLLVNGSVHVLVSDELAAKLKPHAGQPCELRVTELSSGHDGESVELQAAGKVEAIAPSPNFTLGLDAAVATTGSALPDPAATGPAKATYKVVAGEGVRLLVQIANETKNEVLIQPQNFSLVLTADGPTREPAGWKDPENRAYWYRSLAVQGPDLRARALIRAHSQRLEITSQRLLQDGQKFRPGDSGQPPAHVILEPGARATVIVTAGKELEPGEYEAYIVYGDPGLDTPAPPMSPRLPFDVVAKPPRP